MSTLLDFLETGRLGKIEPGMSSLQIRQVLGKPAGRSLQKRPEVWKYGPVQIALSKEKDESEATLCFIGWYFREPNEVLPQSLQIDGWLPTSNTSLGDFKAHLASIQFSEVSLVAKEEGDRLIMQSGASVIFDEGKLHSIQYSLPVRSKSKQIAVQLPEDVIAALRHEAARQQVSLSTLCARWITQHATGLSALGSS